MAIAYKCDICGKLIDPSELKIRLDGYWVYHGIVEEKRHKDYGLEHVDIICSFSCLSKYAEREQKVIDDMESVLLKTDKADKEGEQE